MSRGYGYGNIDIKWPLIQLNTALNRRNILEFRTALDVLDQSAATDDSYLAVFEKALQTRGCAAFVEECLKYGFAPNYVNKNDNKSALNYAADSKDPKILEVLLGVRKSGINVDFKYNGLTPLNWLAKHLKEQNITDITKCVKILLNHGASPNIADQKEMTPLHYVVDNGDLKDVKKQELIKLFLSWPNIDIDTNRKGKLRTSLTEKFPHIKLPGKYKRSAVSFNTLLRYIQYNDMDSFEIDFKSNLRNTTEEENQQLLIKSIELKRHLAFDMIMETGLDYNKNVRNNRTPFEIACANGNSYALMKLLRKSDIQIRQYYYPLKAIIYNISESVKTKRHDYWMCFCELLTSDKIDINQVDGNKSTALHYAVKYRCNGVVKKLLESGADITIKNDENKIPIDGMNPEILKEHFDSCITFANSDDDDSDDENDDENDDDDVENHYDIDNNDRHHGDDVDDDDDDNNSDEICIDFKNLRPTKNSSSHNRVEEMECIEFMAKSENYRDILKHPVITSYLFLKWHKHSLMFYINFCFYIFYAISVITYSILKFNQSKYEVLIFKTFSFIGFSYMLQREFIQFVSKPKRYICTISNYVEIVLIGLSFAAFMNFDHETERQLVIFTILLAAFELYLQVGSIPVSSISTHMLMLEAVCKTFLKSLLLYSIFIITFPLCFYILYAKSTDADKNEGGGDGSGDDDAFHRFQHPLAAISKTLVMLTGEFDAASLNLNSYCSYVVFLLFVFFMTITLYNLLNGMAVSDTQAIKDQAESNFAICRIKSLTGFEQSCFSRKKSDGNSKNSNIKPLLSMWKEFFNGYSQDALCTKIYILPSEDNKILLSKKPLEDFGTSSENVTNYDTVVSFNSDDNTVNSRNRAKKERELRKSQNVLPSWISSKSCAQMDKSIVDMAMSILEESYTDGYEETTEDPLAAIKDELAKIISYMQNDKNSEDFESESELYSEPNSESDAE